MSAVLEPIPGGGAPRQVGGKVEALAVTPAAAQEAPTAPPRVLVIVQNLSVPLDRRVWQECLALVAAGIGVSVICPRGPGEARHEVLRGVHIHRYAPPPATSGFLSYAVEFAYCWLRTAALSVRIARREGFDVIQACNPPDTYWALALPYKALGKRFVFDHHDLNPEVYVSRFGGDGGALHRALHRALLVLERATFRVADHVISTNESYREVAMRRGRRAPADVSVVRSGPDAAVMRRGEAVPELRRGRKHLAVYLGIMGPQDGVDGVLHALRRLADRGRDDLHVALLGFGDCLASLRELAVELGVDDRVTFTGRAGPETIRDYLSTASVGLSPDPFSPLNDVSTMNKTLEYMAHELPVVAYDLKETRVSAHDAAVYVPDGDVDGFATAIADLLDDEERRDEMGRRGRRRIEDELAWQHQVPHYVDVYRSLLPSSRPGTGPAPTPAGRARPGRVRTRRSRPRRARLSLLSLLNGWRTS